MRLQDCTVAAVHTVYDDAGGRAYSTSFTSKREHSQPDVSIRDRRLTFFLKVAQSLNVLWLISAGSLEDPFCLMEVCAAVRQGTPVIPVRLAGAKMRPLNLPIWPYSIAAKSSHSVAAGADVVDDGNAKSSNNKTFPTDDNLPNANGCDRDTSRHDDSRIEHGLATAGSGDDTYTAAETRERARRLRRRAADGFYQKLAQRLPKPVQTELHNNRFLVKDVLAAVRVCFESVEEGDGNTGQVPALQSVKAAAAPSNPKPLVFDLSAPPADHERIINALMGVNCRKKGERGGADAVDHQQGRGFSSPWNWEQVPRNAPLAGRARVNDAVPWRTDEEISEMVRMENAEADDLAGGSTAVCCNGWGQTLFTIYPKVLLSSDPVCLHKFRVIHTRKIVCLRNAYSASTEGFLANVKIISTQSLRMRSQYLCWLKCG